MPFFISILALVLSLPASADSECHPHYWTLHGDIGAEVIAYDSFIKGLPVNAATEINDYIHKHGLLQQLKSTTPEVEGYENYLAGEGKSGLIIGLFLKYMRVVPRSSVSFSTVYEIENAKSKRAVHKWNVPFGARPPVAVEAFDIVYPETLSTVCSESNRQIFVRVSNEGIYAVTARDSFPSVTAIAEKECDAQREFFKKSKTAACAEFKDLVSGKTRTLVWDAQIK